MPRSAYREPVDAYLSPDVYERACRYFATKRRGDRNGILEATLRAYITGADARSVQDRTLARLARGLGRIATHEEQRIEFAGRFMQLCALQVPAIPSEEAWTLARRNSARGMEKYRREQQALADRGRRFVDELRIAPTAEPVNDPLTAENVVAEGMASAVTMPEPPRFGHESDARRKPRARIEPHATGERKRKEFRFFHATRAPQGARDLQRVAGGERKRGGGGSPTDASRGGGPRPCAASSGAPRARD